MVTLKAPRANPFCSWATEDFKWKPTFFCSVTRTRTHNWIYLHAQMAKISKQTPAQERKANTWAASHMFPCETQLPYHHIKNSAQYIIWAVVNVWFWHCFRSCKKHSTAFRQKWRRKVPMRHHYTLIRYTMHRRNSIKGPLWYVRFE